MKGLETEDIKRLGQEAFEEAVGLWGQHLDVDKETLEALAGKAKEVSGDIGRVFFFFFWGGGGGVGGINCLGVVGVFHELWGKIPFGLICLISVFSHYQTSLKTEAWVAIPFNFRGLFKGWQVPQLLSPRQSSRRKTFTMTFPKSFRVSKEHFLELKQFQPKPFKINTRSIWMRLVLRIYHQLFLSCFFFLPCLFSVVLYERGPIQAHRTTCQEDRPRGTGPNPRWFGETKIGQHRSDSSAWQMEGLEQRSGTIFLLVPFLCLFDFMTMTLLFFCVLVSIFYGWERQLAYAYS